MDHRGHQRKELKMAKRITAETKGDIFERLPREPEEAFFAFVKYRDAPLQERNIKRLFADKDDKFLNRVRKWRRDYNWDFRVDCWVAHLDAVKRDAFRKEFEEAGKRQAQNARSYQAFTMTLHKEFFERLGDEEFRKQLRNLDMKDLIKEMINAARVLPMLQEEERKAMGINPTININVAQGLDLTKLSDEELAKLYDEIRNGS